MEIDGCPIEVHTFANKAELEAARADVLEKIRNIAYYEDQPQMAKLAESNSVAVIDGDLKLQADEEESCFRRIFGLLPEEAANAFWLVFTGNLEIEEGMRLEDRGDKVIVFGDLKANGVGNTWGQLYVMGKTTIPGILFFDSDNGGYTAFAELAEPIGLVATSANAFDIPLRAHYLLDPIFNGFEGPPKSPHDERIRDAFVSPPRVISVDDFARLFEKKHPDVAEEIRNGGHFTLAEQLATDQESDFVIEGLNKLLG